MFDIGPHFVKESFMNNSCVKHMYRISLDKDFGNWGAQNFLSWYVQLYLVAKPTVVLGRTAIVLAGVLH